MKPFDLPPREFEAQLKQVLSAQKQGMPFDPIAPPTPCDRASEGLPITNAQELTTAQTASASSPSAPTMEVPSAGRRLGGVLIRQLCVWLLCLGAAASAFGGRLLVTGKAGGFLLLVGGGIAFLLGSSGVSYSYTLQGASKEEAQKLALDEGGTIGRLGGT